MSKLLKIEHRFVKDIPRTIEAGVLYISLDDSTAKHKCCCGCGYAVVTPISPTDWDLEFDGKTVTLEPSIGNWSYPCQSHYYIRRSKVIWVGKMSKAEIARGRELDHRAKDAYFKSSNGTMSEETPSVEPQTSIKSASFFEWVRRWFS